jgi:hypothetical protein
MHAFKFLIYENSKNMPVYIKLVHDKLNKRRRCGQVNKLVGIVAKTSY